MRICDLGICGVNAGGVGGSAFLGIRGGRKGGLWGQRLLQFWEISVMRMCGDSDGASPRCQGLEGYGDREWGLRETGEVCGMSRGVSTDGCLQWLEAGLSKRGNVRN